MGSKANTGVESASIPGAIPAGPPQEPPIEPGTDDAIDQHDVDAPEAAVGEPAAANQAGSTSQPASPRHSPGGNQLQPFEFSSFDAQPPPAVDAKRVSMLSDVNLRVKIELGRTRMLVEDVLKLGEGSVVELDKLAGDPVDVYANDRLVARGEVLVLDESFCVRISDVVSRDPHRIIR